MKMSFLISTSWIQLTSDGAGFKPIATYPDNISTIKARGTVKVLGHPIFVIDFCLCDAISVRHADRHALIRFWSAKNSHFLQEASATAPHRIAVVPTTSQTVTMGQCVVFSQSC
ncbi:hypothetical protein [Dokdonella sp.]|jgi:hypothetical protein|uniref:hypothetical protein n=1 Tax=Dokdonella sp. TaxID=2291710 RepID=UPI002DD6793D|nr:hypothetical protein [Dokdonella sp.]